MGEGVNVCAVASYATAHNNSLENFMLFAVSVIFSMMMGVPEKDVRVAAGFYFVMR